MSARMTIDVANTASVDTEALEATPVISERFPFPHKELAEQELALDPCGKRIPEQARQEVVNEAWNSGVMAAQNLYDAMEGEYNFFRICAHHGITVMHKDIDCVHGTQRYFSDYISQRSLVTLYDASCELWAQAHGFTLEEAQNLILSHEFFHVLEVIKLGLTSEHYHVPLMQIGPLHFGTTGVRALSEIGAHGFARTYYDLTQGG